MCSSETRKKNKQKGIHEISEQESPLRKQSKEIPRVRVKREMPRGQGVPKKPAHTVQVCRLCKRFLQDQFDGEEK